MNKPNLTIPTIHLNGSSKDALRNGYCDAARAVARAIDAVSKTDPHGRDYYVQGGDALENARREHVARLHRLQKVHDELQALAEAVENQGGK